MKINELMLGNWVIAPDEDTRELKEEQRQSENGITYQEWCEIRWLFNMGYEPERIRAELAEQRKQGNQ